jgi:hypothetical protein
MYREGRLNCIIFAHINCHWNVCTELLPDNDKGIHVQEHRLLRGVYEIRRLDGLRCHDVDTKFHEDLFRHSKVKRRCREIRPRGVFLQRHFITQRRNYKSAYL